MVAVKAFTSSLNVAAFHAPVLGRITMRKAHDKKEANL